VSYLKLELGKKISKQILQMLKSHGLDIKPSSLIQVQKSLGYSNEDEIEDEAENIYNILKETKTMSIAKAIDNHKLKQAAYFQELRRMQVELVKLQEWVIDTGQKIAVIFEGRDAAGKGGVLKRITQRLNPRAFRVVALNKPTDEEKTQWYFQRYIKHLPSGGEMVFFDRSWYNRAGVEKVMSFCSKAEIEDFYKTVPQLEKMFVQSGIKLIKYWFSVSDEEQQFRFYCRINDPLKQWKLSPMDLQSRIRWEDYTKAKELMFKKTNILEAPWYTVPADDKMSARLNCIAHILSLFPYKPVPKEKVELPSRKRHADYQRERFPKKMIIPQVY
jgi:polyphosphate kinase